MMNENAISNLLVDCDFLENEFGRIGRPHLSSAFNELRLVSDTNSFDIHFPKIDTVSNRYHRRPGSSLQTKCKNISSQLIGKILMQ